MGQQKEQFRTDASARDVGVHVCTLPHIGYDYPGSWYECLSSHSSLLIDKEGVHLVLAIDINDAILVRQLKGTLRVGSAAENL